MTLVTSANVKDREGWQVSSLGRITRPVRMRPDRPLPETQQGNPMPPSKKNQVRVGATTGEKKKKKRVKDPDSRARRRMIDMTKWGSTHLKGMFLDMPVHEMKQPKLDDVYDPAIESEESEDDNDAPKVSQSSEQNQILSQTPRSPSVLLLTNSADVSTSINPQSSVGEAPLLLDNSTDLGVEKTQSLNILASLFGDQDDDWVRPESVGSDVDVDELTKGDAMLVDGGEDDDGIEVVPVDKLDGGMTKIKGLRNEGKNDKNRQETMEKEDPQVPKMSTKSGATKLKDLFAPREEEGNAMCLL